MALTLADVLFPIEIVATVDEVPWQDESKRRKPLCELLPLVPDGIVARDVPRKIERDCYQHHRHLGPSEVTEEEGDAGADVEPREDRIELEHRLAQPGGATHRSGPDRA